MTVSVLVKGLGAGRVVRNYGCLVPLCVCMCVYVCVCVCMCVCFSLSSPLVFLGKGVVINTSVVCAQRGGLPFCYFSLLVF